LSTYSGELQHGQRRDAASLPDDARPGQGGRMVSSVQATRAPRASQVLPVEFAARSHHRLGADHGEPAFPPGVVPDPPPFRSADSIVLSQEKTMTVSNVFAPRRGRTLQSRIAGRVLVPGDPGYDQGRGGWNLAVDQQPSMLVYAESPGGVV